MVLYSITINIEKEIEEEWLSWMKRVHVPSILDTKLIHENKILRLLTEVGESEGVTYSFQYIFSDTRALEKFQKEFEPAIDTLLYKEYQGRFVEFRTVLEVL